MKIDLPVLIVFDCQQTDAGSIGRSAGHRVCTLRYETDGDGTDAVLFGEYPPNEKPVLILNREFVPQGDPAQGVMAHIPSDVDTRVNARVARSPWDYMVGTDEEREAAQERAGALAAEDGPAE